MLEWFSTVGGGASIVGLLVAIIMVYFERNSRIENRRVQKMLDDGHKRLEKSLEEGNVRLEKSLQEGNRRLEQITNDGHKSLQEGNRRLEQITNDGNRRLETILQNMQARWDQSDEFNKRLLEKILDRVA